MTEAVGPVRLPTPAPSLGNGQRALVRKLAEVMAAIGRIQKKGWNDHFKYKFAQEADVVEKIRRELAERHVMLLPEVVGERRVEIGKTSGGSVKCLTQLDMIFSWIDGDTGEVLQQKWLGSGLDTEDKGAPKAMTGAEKSFLLKTFMIPTGDDPEATDVTGKSTKKTQVPAPTAAPDDERPITPEMVRRIQKAVKAHNSNVDELKAWVERRFKVTTTTAIKRRDYDAVMRYVTEGEDISHGAQQ